MFCMVINYFFFLGDEFGIETVFDNVKTFEGRLSSLDLAVFIHNAAPDLPPLTLDQVI